MTFKVYVFLRSAYPSDVFLIKIIFLSDLLPPSPPFPSPVRPSAFSAR